MMEIVTSIVLLFLGIAILVTIHVCIIGRAFGRGDDHDGDNNGGILMTRRGASMSREEIKKLPSFDYKVEEDHEMMREEKISSNSSGFDCAVCLENFKVGDKCRLLPKCKHSFHVQCIDSWLVKTGACPICRTGAGVVLELPRFSGESSSSHSSEVAGLELT